MKAGGKWMKRIYKSGNVTEVSVFTVGANAKPRAPRKKGNTPPRKQEQNERYAALRLARTINCNFSHGDLWVTLTYRDDALPENREIALHDLRLFLRRVKRELAKQGTAFKYIAITSDMDGESETPTRIHHHVIMPRLPFEAVGKQWEKHGTTNYQILRNQPDYTPLAVYLLRQVKRVPDQKKYMPSRNLEKPIVEEYVISAPDGELRPPRGAILIERAGYTQAGPAQYIRYTMPGDTTRKKKERKST